MKCKARSSPSEQEAHAYRCWIEGLNKHLGVTGGQSSSRHWTPWLVQRIFQDRSGLTLIRHIEEEKVDPDPEDDQRGSEDDFGHGPGRLEQGAG